MIGNRWSLWAGLIALTSLSGYGDSLPHRRSALRLPGMDVTIDPSRHTDLGKVISLADSQIKRSEDQERQRKSERECMLADCPLAAMSFAELKLYFSEPRHFLSDKGRRGWKELRRLAVTALNTDNLEVRQECVWQMREIAAAMRNNHKSPSPPHMDILQPPLYYLDYAHNPIAKGERVAYNLQRGDSRDLSSLDPLPSTFWVRLTSVSRLDLFHGFGRRTLPDLENRIWTYAAPKTSYGGCPGFEAEAGGVRIKVKFGETTSEPFTARIFWALGYNVEATDYVHHLKLKYDRRLFREFHLRKDVEMKARALMIKIYTVNLQKRHDPFNYIHCAVLKNGERIPGAELKARLLRNSNTGHPEVLPENFRTEFEQEIEWLVTTPANVQTREASMKSIGPWDFRNLDHAERREVRAAGLLGAWVGWFDSRFENTRLKLVERDGTNELRHYFTDLGGGLGKAKGVLSRHCECPNDFGWRFTRPSRPQGKGKMTVPFRIVDYQPIEDTEAFRQMTVDDARWMGRLIAQLTEQQIVEALVASGFDATEVRIYTEKLISRRDWMVRDLSLLDELPLLRPQGVAKALSYDPQTDRPAEVHLANGQKVRPRESSLCVWNGVVWPELHTRTPRQRAAQSENVNVCPLHRAMVE
jgi:hypothetical protein